MLEAVYLLYAIQTVTLLVVIALLLGLPSSARKL